MKKIFFVILTILVSITLFFGCQKKEKMTERERYLSTLEEGVKNTLLCENYSLFGREKITENGSTKESAYSVKSSEGKRVETAAGEKERTEYFLSAEGRYYIGRYDSALGLMVQQTDREDYEHGGLIRFLRIANDFDLLDPTYKGIYKPLDDDISYFIQEVKSRTRYNNHEGYFSVKTSGNKTILRYDEGNADNVTITLIDGVITGITARYHRNYEFDRALEYVGFSSESKDRQRYVEWTVDVEYGQAEVTLPGAFSLIRQETTPLSIGYKDMKNSMKILDAISGISNSLVWTQKTDDGEVATYEYGNNIAHYRTETKEEFYYIKNRRYYRLEKTGDMYREISLSKEKFYERSRILWQDVIGFFGEAFHTPDGQKGEGETVCLYSGLNLSAYYLSDESFALYGLIQEAEDIVQLFGLEEKDEELLKETLSKEVRWEAVVLSGEKEKKYKLYADLESGFVGTVQEGDELQTTIWSCRERQTDIILPEEDLIQGGYFDY